MTFPARTLTANEAVALLEQAADARGTDYVYPFENPDVPSNCHYFSNDEDVERGAAETEGAPLCIVGWALDSLGIKRDDLDALDEEAEPGNANAGATVRGLNRRLRDSGTPFQFETDAVLVFTKAQQAQDNGSTWGEAVTAARTEFQELNA